MASNKIPASITNRNRKKKKAFAKPKNIISLDSAHKITKIFERKKWTSYSGYECHLQKYLTLIGKLNADQKKLFIELTERFEWIKEYSDHLIDLINKITSEFKRYQNFYVIRCFKKDNERLPRSSMIMIYDLMDSSSKLRLNKQIEILDNMSELKKKIKDFEKSLLIIVDDFIGSGKTISECVDYMISKQPELKGNMVVLSIATLKQAKDKLKAKGIPLFYAYIQERGISDYYKGYSLKKNISLMEEIESALNISSFNFGFGKSEALICMKRCPNNTFPVYWHDEHSPYPRY